MPLKTTLHVRKFLDDRKITAYQLVKASRGRLPRNTIYNLVTGDPKRVDLKSLATLAELIEEVSGQQVTLHDLLIHA